MAITVEEVKEIAERWCDTLRDGETPASERAKFFLHPMPRIYIIQSGISITMEEHAALHSQFSHQILTLGDFTISQLCDEPERARAIGSLYWEAHFPDDSKPPLRCIVGEDWLFERIPSGELRYVLWLNTMHHFLEDSSVGHLEL
jgi:hypothetical protein